MKQYKEVVLLVQKVPMAGVAAEALDLVGAEVEFPLSGLPLR